MIPGKFLKEFCRFGGFIPIMAAAREGPFGSLFGPVGWPGGAPAGLLEGGYLLRRGRWALPGLPGGGDDDGL